MRNSVYTVWLNLHILSFPVCRVKCLNEKQEITAIIWNIGETTCVITSTKGQLPKLFLNFF